MLSRIRKKPLLTSASDGLQPVAEDDSSTAPSDGGGRSGRSHFRRLRSNLRARILPKRKNVIDEVDATSEGGGIPTFQESLSHLSMIDPPPSVVISSQPPSQGRSRWKLRTRFSRRKTPSDQQHLSSQQVIRHNAPAVNATGRMVLEVVANVADLIPIPGIRSTIESVLNLIDRWKVKRILLLAIIT
jgi:hypothetical protein